MIGVLVGAATAVLLLIIVLCVCCPWPCAPADNKSKDIESKGNIESICPVSYTHLTLPTILLV